MGDNAHKLGCGEFLSKSTETSPGTYQGRGRMLMSWAGKGFLSLSCLRLVHLGLGEVLVLDLLDLEDLLLAGALSLGLAGERLGEGEPLALLVDTVVVLLL